VAYGPAELGIGAKEEKARAYGTAGVLEELARSARAETEQTEDPLQQQRRGERSRVAAPPTNPGEMNFQPDLGERMRLPEDQERIGGGARPGLRSVPPDPDLPILDPPVTPLTRLDELNKIARERGKTGVQAYLEDVFASARGAVKEGGAAFEAISRGEDVGPNLLRAGGSALGLLGIPFLYAGGEVVQTGIEANPMMRGRFHELLRANGIDPADQSQPNIRIAIADLVLEEFENAAHDAANDPLLDPGTRISASVISGLIKAEQFAELGGPQGARALAKLAQAMSTRVAAGRAAPRLTVDELTARSGGKTTTAAERTKTDTSPEATAAAATLRRTTREREVDMHMAEAKNARLLGDEKAAAAAEEKAAQVLAQEVADSVEANRLRLEAISGPQAEFAEVVAKVIPDEVSPGAGTALGPVLTDAIKRADREVSRLAAKGAGQGIDLVALDKVIDGLDDAATRAGRAVPEVVMAPLRDLRAQLYDQTIRITDTRTGAVAMNAVYKREAAAAATAEARASRAQFDAAARMARTQARLEEAAGSLGRAQEEAQVVATRKLQAESKRVGAEITEGEGRVATAAKEGQKAEQAIADAADAAKVRIVETGDAFHTDIQNSANAVVVKLARQAERVRAASATERLTTRLRGPKDEPLTGYMAVDDALVWEKMRIHTGKQDSPLTREAMARLAREHGDDIEEALRHVTWKQMLMGIADDLGIDWQALAKKLPNTMEVTRRMYIAQKVLAVMTRDWQRAAVELNEGRITKDAFDVLTGDLITFTRDVSEGISELGRALGAQRLVKRSAAADLVQVRVEVKRRQGTLDKAAEKLEQISAESVKALEDAAKATGRSDQMTAQMVTAIEASRAAAQKVAKSTTAAERKIAQLELDQIEGQLAKLQQQRAQIQNASSTRVREAQARMEQQMENVDAARGAYEAAVQKAADAVKATSDIYVKRAIRLGATPEQMRVLAQLEPENVQGILHFMRDLVPQGRGTGLFTYAMNNMYGSLTSLQNNFLNTGMNVLVQNMVTRPLVELGAPVFNRAVGAPVIVRGETKAAWMAMFSATPDSFRLFGRTILNGESPEIALKYGMVGLTEESGAKFGIGPRPTIAGPKGIPLESALRVLGGSDGFWRIMDTAGEARALQMVDAFRAGKDGEALGNLLEFTTRPTLAQLQRGSRVSLTNTFNDTAEVGTWTQRTLNLLNKDYAGFAPARVLIPAARFGMASAKHAISMTGAGMIGGAAKMRRARGLEGAEQIALGREGARQFIEGSMGAMLLVVASNAYDAGLVTGAYPTRKQDQEQWNIERREEMSILIGGRWVPMSFFGPLAAPFMITALIRDQLEQTDDATVIDRVERAAMGVGKFLTDVPAFSGTYRLMDAVYSGVKYGANEAWDKFASLQIAKFIWQSATLRSLVPVWDPYERDPEGIMERLQARVPIWSTKLPEALTPEGTPRERPVSGPEALRAGAGPEPRALGERDIALAESGQSLLPIGNKIGGEELKREEFRRYQMVAGPLSTEALDRLIATDEYKNETDPVIRQKMREREIDRARVEARKQVSRELLDSAKSEEDVLRAAKMYRSQFTTLRDNAYMVLRLREEGRLTPTIISELDKTRGFVEGTQQKPTVEEMLTDAPRVRQYLAIPPYRTGNAAEWQRLKEARAQESEIRKNDPKAADRFHQNNALLRKYDNTALVNPARAAFRARYPSIVKYVSGTGYTHEP
jgi:hypothetical protein